MKKRNFLAGAGIAAVAALGSGWATLACAQNYPRHEVRFIVPWNPGGSADISARLLSKLVAADGFQLVVENVPGATGSIGLAKVAAAKPDGYTIGLATTSQLALVAQGLTKTKNSEFTPLHQVTTDNYVLVVPKNGPATLGEFLDEVKKRSGKVSVGTAGGNNVPHILTMATAHMAGAQLIHVPYPGGAKAIADLAGSQIDAGVLKPSESKGQIESGMLKAIAAYSDTRVPSLPALSGEALQKEILKTQATLDEVAPRVFKKPV